MGNGDMSATREVVRKKVRVARDLIKSYPLMPELSAELFAQNGLSAFRFSHTHTHTHMQARTHTHSAIHSKPHTNAQLHMHTQIQTRDRHTDT